MVQLLLFQPMAAPVFQVIEFVTQFGSCILKHTPTSFSLLGLGFKAGLGVNEETLILILKIYSEELQELSENYQLLFTINNEILLVPLGKISLFKSLLPSGNRCICPQKKSPQMWMFDFSYKRLLAVRVSSFQPSKHTKCTGNLIYEKH